MWGPTVKSKARVNMEAHAPNKKDVVKFQKLKMKYFQNEDIKVQYVLNPQVRQWPRDWIGLYPCEWNNLQQYITFEWAVCHPCEEKKPYRTITFQHKFHSEAVKFDKQYQLVYVDKNMKVLGCSPYFGFLQPMPFSGVVKSDISMLQSQRNGLKRAPNVYKLLKPTIPPLKLLDVNQLPISQGKESNVIHQITEKLLQESQKSSKQLNCNSSQDDKCPSEADLYICKQNAVSNAVTQLEEKLDNLSESKGVNKEVKHIAKEVLCLQKRIKSLESSLEKSRVSQKILKIAVQRSKREKIAYQNFVSQLLDSLSKSKVVRVIDGQGIEMLVKCVPNTENEDKQSSIPQPNTVKETAKERRLKAVIGFQEQTIQQLQHRLACALKENGASKESKPNEENEPDPCASEPLFTVVRKTMPRITGILDDLSNRRNEMATNLNDVVVSNIEESESQTCIHDAEATEVHVKECAVQEIVAECEVSASGDHCKEPQSSALVASDNNIESGTVPDKELTFVADTDEATGETEVKVVTSAVSPSTVVFHGEKVSFSIVK